VPVPRELLDDLRRALLTSSVTATGRAAATRTAAVGRPTAAAAPRRVGPMCRANVFGPLIQVTVPGERLPASRSSCGPSAAMYTSGAVTKGIGKGSWVRFCTTTSG
jgi:uncharacterized protein involved in high-affinity Fe2+ transport